MVGRLGALLCVLVVAAGCGPAGSGDGADAGAGGDAAAAVDSGAGADGAACGTPGDQAGCDCQSPGQTRGCYTGDPATRGVGLCKDGMQTCVAKPASGEVFGAPGSWGPCSGDALPATAELCSDGLDHDCNGSAGCSDPGCGQSPGCLRVCHTGETRPCYTGAPGTSGVGACHAGTQTCNAMGQWDPACNGQVTPTTSELFQCHDGVDNDCNGRKDCQELVCLLDPGCAPMVCTPSAMQPCYDGPAGTSGVAACHGGMQTCASDGKSWGACLNQVVPAAEGGHCADGVDNDCNGQTDCADPACSSAPNCCVRQPGTVDGTIYAHSPDDLYTVNPSGWVVTHIGPFANGDPITDLAVTPDGHLYGISFTTLYSVDKTTGKATRIADVPGTSNNGLTFLADGSLLASDSAGDLKKISPASGAVSDLGNFQQSLSSSGDLVAIANGTMYGVSSTSAGGGDAGSNNLLLRVNPATGQATVVGPIGFGSVWGLAYVNAKVIGFTTSGQIIEIDPQTGAGTLLATRSVAWWGASMSPLVQGSVCP